MSQNREKLITLQIYSKCSYWVTAAAGKIQIISPHPRGRILMFGELSIFFQRRINKGFEKVPCKDGDVSRN